MGFPRSLPRSRYPLFRPRRIDLIIKNLEREVQLDQFIYFEDQLGEFMVDLEK